MEPYVLGREEGEAIWMFDALDTIKAAAERTGGGFSVVEFLDFEGSSVPLHVNDRWDTGFYILDGEYSFVIADETVAVVRIVGVCATGDSARVAVRFTRGPAPERDCAEASSASTARRARACRIDRGCRPAANRMSKRSRTRRPGTAAESWGHRPGRSYPGVRPGHSRRLVTLADSAIGGASCASALEAERRLGWRSQEMQGRR